MNRLRTLFFLTCGLLAACDGTHKDRAVPDLPDVQASLAFTCAYEKDTIPPRAPEADQLHPILGSANISDRSVFGERDSEIAVLINDGDTARRTKLESNSEPSCRRTTASRESLTRPCTSSVSKGTSS